MSPHLREEHSRQEKEKCKDLQVRACAGYLRSLLLQQNDQGWDLGGEFRKVPGSQITCTPVGCCEDFSFGEATGRFGAEERHSLTYFL